MEIWQLIIAIAGGGALAEGLRWLKELWIAKKDKGQLFHLVFEGLTTIYENMSKVLAITPAERFLILKTENGGGRPHPGSHLYASVIHEDYIDPMRSVKADYQRLHVDKDYLEMLAEAERTGYVKMSVESMPKESLLKRIYQSEGIVYSEIYFIHQDDIAFYYCSISSTSIQDFDHPLVITTIDLAINNIRNVFKNYLYQ